jgi:hypothetical protein
VYEGGNDLDQIRNEQMQQNMLEDQNYEDEQELLNTLYTTRIRYKYSFIYVDMSKYLCLHVCICIRVNVTQRCRLECMIHMCIHVFSFGFIHV